MVEIISRQLEIFMFVSTNIEYTLYICYTT